MDEPAARVAEFKIRMTTKSLVLKRGDPSRRRDNDYDVLEDGKVVSPAASLLRNNSVNSQPDVAEEHGVVDRCDALWSVAVPSTCSTEGP